MWWEQSPSWKSLFMMRQKTMLSSARSAFSPTQTRLRQTRAATPSGSLWRLVWLENEWLVTCKSNGSTLVSTRKSCTAQKTLKFCAFLERVRLARSIRSERRIAAGFMPWKSCPRSSLLRRRKLPTQSARETSWWELLLRRRRSLLVSSSRSKHRQICTW